MAFPVDEEATKKHVIHSLERERFFILREIVSVKIKTRHISKNVRKSRKTAKPDPLGKVRKGPGKRRVKWIVRAVLDRNLPRNGL